MKEENLRIPEIKWHGVNFFYRMMKGDEIECENMTKAFSEFYDFACET